MVLEIKDSLAGPDTRWTYFQAPFLVEDALGFKFPVPSEYDFELLDAVVKHKFTDGPGAFEVEAGNYEYFKTKNSNDVLLPTSRLLPGTAITMTILVARSTRTDEFCPMPNCFSNQTTEAPGGGRIWFVSSLIYHSSRLTRSSRLCNVWFSPASKKRKPLDDLLYVISQVSPSPISDDHNDGYKDGQRARKRLKRSLPAEGDTYFFKNVRLSHMVDAQNPAKRLESTMDAFVDEAYAIAFPDDTLIDSDTDQKEKEKEEEEKVEEEVANEKSSRPNKEDSVEFKHAISYINKIQARVQSHPETYKTFLEILQDYQHRAKPIQDVYSEVEILFSDHPDLIIDFKQFLPESAARNSPTVESSADKSARVESSSSAVPQERVATEPQRLFSQRRYPWATARKPRVEDKGTRSSC